MGNDELWGWDDTNEIWLPLSCNADGKLLLDPTDLFENPPTEDETEKAPNSEWAFDHNADVAAHHARYTDAEAIAAAKADADIADALTKKHTQNTDNKIVDPTDADTLVEAEEDQVTMDVAGTEAFKLSNVGILDLAKQSGAKAYLSSAVQVIPNNMWIRVILDAIDHDTQSEFDNTIKTGAADATEAFKLHDADGGFTAADIGAWVWNTTDNTYAKVTGFVDSGELDLDTNIMVNGEGYKLYRCIFTATQAGRYLAIGSHGYQVYTANTEVSTSVIKNGAGYSTLSYTKSIANWFWVQTSAIVNLAVGDYLELWGKQVGGAANNILNAQSVTYLSVRKLS